MKTNNEQLDDILDVKSTTIIEIDDDKPYLTLDPILKL